LLDNQLSKINKFFNRSHQEYIATMNVSWAFSQTCVVVVSFFRLLVQELLFYNFVKYF
jgi:hypothetical protein